MSLYVYIEKSIINKKITNIEKILNDFNYTRGKEIRLSLWGTSVLRIDEDVYKNNLGPFVLIATLTIVKSFGGKYN